MNEIKGWRERAGRSPDYQLTCPSAVEKAMEAEIAELRRKLEGASDKYGCHCDLEPHMEPDGCVIDDGRREDCLYARRYATKEQCIYWQKVATPTSEAQP